MILAYSFYFIILSLRSSLPWEKCDPAWASENCVDDFNPEVFKFDKCENLTTMMNENIYRLKCDNGKCYNITEAFNLNGVLDKDALCRSNESFVGWHNPKYPSEDYWQLA